MSEHAKTYEVMGFSGTAVDLVRNMHKASRSQCQDDATWMHETAIRVALQNGKVIRHDTPEHFIDDLLAHGLLTNLE